MEHHHNQTMDHSDWQINKRPLQCTKYMLEHEIDCDVNFKVGENQETIKAHKLILSMRSPVFQKMLNGPFIETRQDPVIPDVEPEAFRALLRYCYYECVDIEEDVALSILCASKKYMLPLLERASGKKLIECLSGSNIWDLYIYAISVEDTRLCAGCKRYFQGSVTAVREALDSEAFLNIPHEVLQDLLHINNKADDTVIVKEGEQYYKNSFGISISEIALFKSCNAWAAAECLRQEIDPTGDNKRAVLGECLFLLRFPTMIYKELVNVVYPTGILTQAEKDNLCQYKHRQTGLRCQVDFPSRERQFMVVSSERTTGRGTATLYVESNERIMLTRVWTEYEGSYRATVKGERYESSWSKRCDTKFQNYMDDANELYFLDLEPQLLKAGHRYSVRIERLADVEAVEDISDKENIIIGELAPVKEVKITQNPNAADIIYALTLSFV